MSTYVAGPNRRRDLTPASFEPLGIDAACVGDITADGVAFSCDLTSQQTQDVWWLITSRDNADETTRRDLKALLDADDPGLCAALTRYLLGIEDA